MLLAAKVLVLSRRLHKALTGRHSTRTFLESLRVRLGKLRQKLLEVIDERLAEEEADAGALVDALCAYSLATSSSCADVFRHFHHVRADALSNRAEQVGTPGAAVQASLRIWIRTLRETRSLFPRQVSNALATLKEQPLLQDKDVLSSPELDLDVHGVWIDEEAKNFVPYVRSDDLQVAPAAQQLSVWAASALEKLLKGIDASLVDISDPRNVVDLRREAIQLWLSNSNNLHGVNKRQVLERFRNSFQEKLSSLIRERCQSISDVGSYINYTAEDSTRLEEESRALPGLWTASVVSMDLVPGTEPFVNLLDASYRGRTSALVSTAQRYNKWLRSIEVFRAILAHMTESRWDDEDDFEDSLSDSDEDPSVTPHTLLSVQDPLALASLLDESLKSALTSFATVFSPSNGPPSPTNALKAAYLLRALRDMTALLPSPSTSLPALRSLYYDSVARPSASPDQFFKLFLPLVPSLHSAVSGPLVETLLARYQTLLGRLKLGSSPVPGRGLWDDGAPPLPTLPSPTAFRLLREVYKALESAGPDLWTGQALEVLRETLRTRLAQSLVGKTKVEVTDQKGTNKGELTEVETEPAEGKAEGKGTEAENKTERAESTGEPTESEIETVERREAGMQRLFDLSLVCAATSKTLQNPSVEDKTEKKNALNALRDQWIKDLGLTGTSAVATRIHRNATAYWARSRLLFGLLGAMTAPAGQTGSRGKIASPN